MEKEFLLLVDENRKTEFPELAKKLDMSDRQVKRWFENRRQKWKKMNNEKAQPSSVSINTTCKSIASADTVSKNVQKSAIISDLITLVNQHYWQQRLN